MKRLIWPVKAAAVILTLAAVPAAMVIDAPGAVADVCGSVGGRHVSVGGCANLADTIADYVPPPAYYAPMPEDETAPEYAAPPPPPSPPPNVSVCANVGRRINVSACT